MDTTTAKFTVGEIIHHRLFEYRGVIIDVDPHFLGTEDWYRKIAASRPPRDRPWYHVLVDGFAHRTYVAERNLEPDTEGGPVKHTEIAEHFEGMTGDRYISRRREN
jgi:heat shock protein HspQ